VNVIIWLMGGAVAAWFGCSLLRFNLKVGLALSVLIGAAGGVLGGALLAPLLGPGTVHPDDFNPLAFVAAIATGLACVIVSDMIRKRFGT
jgi:uncharacterized membrane protein YeaQ/YmgE (transglycosylase-associated protein family)